ncbi:hypothetical protein [Burkholderia anthina]|uniref:hypothetical protein n=1 Tax=Burkholderia anthina TaxID=179879 RepID=UPI00158E84AB|nr:hypothetical protein [Burkholderia anthina]
MKFEPPICSICNRTVDHFEWVHDLVIGRITFTARCHGDTQIQYLDDRDLERLGPDNVSIGYAFTPHHFSVIVPISTDGRKA